MALKDWKKKSSTSWINKKSNLVVYFYHVEKEIYIETIDKNYTITPLKRVKFQYQLNKFMRDYMRKH